MRHVSLVVTHLDDQRTYHSVEGRGWRIDPIIRAIVIGKGTSRTIVPLDNVRCIEFAVRDELPRVGIAVPVLKAPPTPDDRPKPSDVPPRVPTFVGAQGGINYVRVWTSETGTVSRVVQAEL